MRFSADIPCNERGGKFKRITCGNNNINPFVTEIVNIYSGKPKKNLGEELQPVKFMGVNLIIIIYYWKL